MRLAAPTSWPTGPTYRACAVCTHGLAGEGRPRPGGEATHCTCPSVTGRTGARLEVQRARANHGPCGPEAHHLTFPGLLP